MEILAIIIPVTGCIVCAMRASNLNRSALGWGIFGFFLPIVALIVIFCLKPKIDWHEEKADFFDDDQKQRNEQRERITAHMSAPNLDEKPKEENADEPKKHSSYMPTSNLNSENDIYSDFDFKHTLQNTQKQQSAIENKTDDKVCQSCKDIKEKWTIITAMFALLFVVAVGFAAHFNSGQQIERNRNRRISSNYTGDIRRLEAQVREQQAKINELTDELNESEDKRRKQQLTQFSFVLEQVFLENEVSRLETRIRDQQATILDKEREITRLRTQLPQTFRTRFANQNLYNQCGGTFEQTTCRFSNSGSTVTIYLQRDGFGLTHTGGWIPMSRLQRVEN